MKLFFATLLLAVPLMFALQGFEQHDSPSSIQADTVCFSRDVLPIINSNCAMAKCHDAITHSEGFTLTSYQGVMKGVKAGNPNTSSIYREINNNAMPQAPFNKLPDSMKSIIRLWIEQGAKNSNCPVVNCDSTDVTFAAHIKPLIQKNCLGCHSGGKPEGGISLVDDELVEAMKERILCSVTHGNGCKPMPPNNVNLNMCELGQVRAWVMGTSSVYTNTNDTFIHSLSVLPSNDDAVRVRFTLEQKQHLVLSLYSYSGKEVRRFEDADFLAGEHERLFTTSQLSGGVYFLRLQAGNSIRSVMMVR